MNDLFIRVNSLRIERSFSGCRTYRIIELDIEILLSVVERPLLRPLSNTTRSFLLLQTIIICKAQIGPRLFDRIEIFALRVFNQRQFQDLHVTSLPDNYRCLLGTNILGGTSTPFLDNQFVPIVDETSDERLNDPLFPTLPLP